MFFVFVSCPDLPLGDGPVSLVATASTQSELPALSLYITRGCRSFTSKRRIPEMKVNGASRRAP